METKSKYVTLLDILGFKSLATNNKPIDKNDIKNKIENTVTFLHKMLESA
jgi:hypothetical protein